MTFFEAYIIFLRPFLAFGLVAAVWDCLGAWIDKRH